MTKQPTGITYHDDLTQGTDEWLSARRGLLTASEMKLIITPAKLQYASNDKERAHLYEIVAQRISGYTEPSYIGDDMIRGTMDEQVAREYYRKYYAPVQEMGFVTNDKWGFTLGYSPDGLVGDDGCIEIKSRRQKYQIQTIIENECPTEHMIQVQSVMLVSERDWCDFISFSSGLPMMTLRIHADSVIQQAIASAAAAFEEKAKAKIAEYHARLADANGRYVPTERIIQAEISV